MHTLIAWLAQYLIWAMAVVWLILWMRTERGHERQLIAVAAVAGIGVALIVLWVAGLVHHDPRPFVENPRIKPFFHHDRSDGFPSSTAASAGLMASLVVIRHRAIGLILWIAAGVVAWARVVAHVHHVQDVVAGLLIGALAAGVGFWLAPRALMLLNALRTKLGIPTPMVGGRK